MNELRRVALEVQRECEKRGWRFCFIGGLAVQHWGEPRFTRDVDLTLLTGFGGEETYIDPLLEVFEPRIEDCREFALQNRVLLLKSAEGIGIDVALGALPFEEEAARRSRLIEVEPDAVLIPLLNDNRSFFAPEGQTSRSPWQRHGYGPLQNPKP